MNPEISTVNFSLCRLQILFPLGRLVEVTFINRRVMPGDDFAASSNC